MKCPKKSELFFRNHPTLLFRVIDSNRVAPCVMWVLLVRMLVVMLMVLELSRPVPPMVPNTLGLLVGCTEAR